MPIAVLSLMALASQVNEPGFDALREAGQWKRLRPRIEGWYRMKPQDPYAIMWMSRLRLAFGREEEALELAKQAVALSSQDAELQTQLGVAFDACLKSANGPIKQFPLARGMKAALEAAAQGNPSSKEANNLLLRFYLAAPGIAGGSVSNAKALADRFSVIDPAMGLVFKSLIAIYEKDRDKAVALLKQAISVDPKCTIAYRELVTLYLGMKPQAIEEALQTCRKALIVNPKHVDSYGYLAALLAYQGKISEANQVLAQAKQNCPENLSPNFMVAGDLIASKQFDKAEPYIRTYLSQEPEGYAPDHAAAHALLGKLFEKQGRKQDAINAYQTAVNLKPGFEHAVKQLERLRKG